MNEPVSSPSLLTITAPPIKTPRAESEDFGKQLHSVAKADESRSPVPKKEKVKTEETPAVSSPEKKEVRSGKKQETAPSDETPGVTSQEDVQVIDSRDGEGAADTLVGGLAVVAPVIVTPVLEELTVSEELLPVVLDEEIAAITGETPDDASDPTKEQLDLETNLKSTGVKAAGPFPENSIAEGSTTEADVPETIATAAEVAAKPLREAKQAAPAVALSEEESSTAPRASEFRADDDGTDKEKESQGRSEPSLLAKANKAAIQGNNKEQGETDQPIQEPLASLSASTAVAAASAAVESVSNDDSHPDTNEGTGRNATTISAAEERTNQRAELVAAAKTRTNSAPIIDPSRFVSRVTKAFEAAQQQGGGPIRMRLSPPELGMLQVQIEVKEGVLTASLEAETHAARNLLLENLPALRDRLAEQQISIEKFDVDVRDESSGPDYEQANSSESDADAQRDRQNQPHTSNDTDLPSDNSTTEESTTTPSTISFDNDRVDLVA